MISGFEESIPYWVQGERRMLAQMITNAVADLNGPPEDRNEAIEWFNEDRGPDDLGAFAWACSHLHLNTEVMRRKINHIIKNPKGVQHGIKW